MYKVKDKEKNPADFKAGLSWGARAGYNFEKLYAVVSGNDIEDIKHINFFWKCHNWTRVKNMSNAINNYQIRRVECITEGGVIYLGKVVNNLTHLEWEATK